MKIDTSTLLIAGVAAVGVYMITRPKTVLPYPQQTYNPYGSPAYNPYQQTLPGNTTAGIITAAGGVLDNIGDLVSNLFG